MIQNAGKGLHILIRRNENDFASVANDNDEEDSD